jgi:primosomal protein N' (replication factor Y)
MSNHGAKTQSSGPRYAEVAVPLHVSQTFTYKLKPSMQDEAAVGSRIVVPLGRTAVTGYIVGLREELETETNLNESEIKEAENILDPIPLCTPEILAITRWVSEYYASPWGEIIKAALPPGISPALVQVLSLTDEGLEQSRSLSEDEPASLNNQLLLLLSHQGEVLFESLSKLAPRSQVGRTIRDLETRGWVRRTQRSSDSFVKQKVRRAVRLIASSPPTLDGTTAAQQRVLETLKDSRTIGLKHLLEAARVSRSVVDTLVNKGVLEFLDQAVRRDPLENASLPDTPHHNLTPEQAKVLSSIEEQLSSRTYNAFLLHGVTGSGKTEVYLRAMRRALELGRTAMMLVPEIALTPVFSRRLRAEFGDQIAIFHSSLPKGERLDEWMRVKNREARVVIGTRSAVFAPLHNLGLVIVDEEHEATYRQQDSPYYNARDTAVMRAQKESATVVLGSATPSLESFHNARSGKYIYLSLPKRIGNRPMAEAQIIDMREVFARHSKPQVFSDELLGAIRETQERNEQSIILLNRRGFSSFILCRSCGETVQCPNCDVTLTYHRSERAIICHYCNHRQASPSQCPSCFQKYIHYVGEGTEQIEDTLRALFPALRIARIDRDTTARRSQFEKSLLDFAAGRLDMLVGTQILAKGHDFPNVTLVGVVSVDAGLALADFRSAERTFQLITQVAGRAGRGQRGGRVLIQTYHPQHYALRHACAQDYAAFYSEEIRYRKNHLYPPFVSLGLLLLHGRDLRRVRDDAVNLRKELDSANNERACRILGPAPAPLSRLKNEYRFQILVKSRNRRQLRGVVDKALKSMVERGLQPRSVNFEVDPVSIL